jgi:hypothetical protein
MFAYSETSRLVAQAMLDVATANSVSSASQELNESMMLIALQRFDEIEGAYTVDIDDEGDDLTVTVNLSQMVAGAMIPLTHLVRQLAAARGVDEEVVIIELREYIDTQV